MSEIASFIPTLIAFALVAYPIGRIYKRLGYSPWWGLGCFVPLGIFVLLWWRAVKVRPLDQSALGDATAGAPRV